MTLIQQLTLADWHNRYRQQATWSGDIRRYLFGKAADSAEGKILEVGSGTGVVLSILSEETDGQLFGIDIDFPVLLFSADKHPEIHLTTADGFHLPFLDNSFNITFCHYLLLWIRDPLKILIEMKRVTKPGGYVIALSEPDYQARIDYPQPLDKLAQEQTESLEEQGIDPLMGRKLAGLFHNAGLNELTAGILGAQWDMDQSQTIDEKEWMMIRSDLSGKLSPEDLDRYCSAEAVAREKRKRILFIPTFYASGKVP